MCSNTKPVINPQEHCIAANAPEEVARVVFDPMTSDTSTLEEQVINVAALLDQTEHESTLHAFSWCAQ